MSLARFKPGGGLGTPVPGYVRAGSRPASLLAPLRHLDWVLLTAVLGLSVIGTLLVWSATRPALLHARADPDTYLKKQLLIMVAGLALLAAASLPGRAQLRSLAPAAYGVALLGLAAVLSPLGSTVNGGRSWISLPAGFQVEPSEHAKLALILVTAVIFARVRTADRRPGIRHAAAALGCAAPLIGLVLLEPALGVAIVLTVVLAGLIALSGISLRWLAALGAAAIAGALAVWRLHLLQPYQLQRLTSFANPSVDPNGTGYSVAQAKIAIGSGGLLGQGLFHGPLIAGNFIPNQQTDFIFAVAGDQLGFAGAVTIIALLAVVVLRALRIARLAGDQFGMLTAAGIALWFAVQSFINIGMTLGIMPVTGLPLPFVSYGGSALFADMIAVGILQCIHQRHQVFG